MSNYSNNTRKLCCNHCHAMLTNKALASYSYTWQHSGDMYCMKCRKCPDDCRMQVCEQKRAKLLRNAIAAKSWLFANHEMQASFDAIIANLRDMSIPVETTCNLMFELHQKTGNEQSFYARLLLTI